MKLPPRPWVTAVGARAAIGLTSLQVAMSARAGKVDQRSTEIVDRHKNRIGASRMRSLPADLGGAARFVAIGGPAIAEATHAVVAERRLPLFLAMPDAARVDQRREGFEGEVVGALARACASKVDAMRAKVFRADNAGFAIALAAAKDALAMGEPEVVVGGVDSCADAEVLRALDDERRLYSTKGDGIFAGEGAGFAVLTRAPDAEARPYAAILDVAIGSEPGGANDDEPNVARAMTDLVRRAAAASPGGKIAWLLTDWNGEHHRASEWAKVALRLDDEIGRADHDRFVEALADVGAATGALLLVIACRLFAARAKPHTHCTIALASEGAERATISLEAAPDPRRVAHAEAR